MASYSAGNQSQKNNTFLYTISATTLNNWVSQNIPAHSTINNVTLTFSAKKGFSAASGSVEIKVAGTIIVDESNKVNSISWYNPTYTIPTQYITLTGANAGRISGDIQIYIDGPWTSVQWTVNNINVNYTYTPPTYTVEVNASPTEGGTISGGGSYTLGSTVTVTANPSDGYTFKGWANQDGVITTTSNPYIFAVNANTKFYAVFEKKTINQIQIGTSKPTGIYINTTTKTITFVIDEAVSITSSGADTVDGYHLVVSNTVPSGATEIKAVQVGTTYVYTT